MGHRILALFVAGFVIIAGTLPASGRSSVPEPRNRSCERSFDRAFQGYQQAFDARDLDRYMSYHRDDAIKINVDGTIERDRAEIEALFAQLFELNFTSDFDTLDSIVDCRTAVAITDGSLVFPDFGYVERFRTSLTFTRERGSWKLLASTSTPLPATQ